MSETEQSPLWLEIWSWLEDAWDPDLSVDMWWERVAEAGWTVPHFSVEHGGKDLPRRSPATVRAAFAEFGALRPPGGLGLLMAAPTILTHGTPDQIKRLVPPIVQGKVGWCQLFSEPGAGSDLAGLTTRATRDGDRWIISGQKVWSSEAQLADHGMLLARTDFDQPKHAGISWFAFTLDQPGVTIRPLREMTGESVFNEVFFDDAVCDHADLIGGEGNGWTIAQTTLHFERTGIGGGGDHAAFPWPGNKGAMLGRRAGDAAQIPQPINNMTVTFADVKELARDNQRAANLEIRQKIARLYSYSQTSKWNATRSRAEARRGQGQGAANVGKLAQTRIVKLAAEVAIDLIGPQGLLGSPSGVEEGRFTDALLFSPASSIYGGSDEIQRNIVAERSLGLPRDPAPYKGMAYSEFLRQIERA